MKILVTVIALCLGLASSASYADHKNATEEKTAKSNTAKPAAKPAAMPTFKLTNFGAPVTRLGGATRSATGTVPRTEALVPEVAGHTLQGQPVLYWYLAGKTDNRIDFALIGVDPINPILETTLEGPFYSQMVRLSALSIRRHRLAGVYHCGYRRGKPNPV